jgi:hypothetical protein
MTPAHWVTGCLPFETKTSPHHQRPNGHEGVKAHEDSVITLFQQVGRRFPLTEATSYPRRMKTEYVSFRLWDI